MPPPAPLLNPQLTSRWRNWNSWQMHARPSRSSPIFPGTAPGLPPWTKSSRPTACAPGGAKPARISKATTSRSTPRRLYLASWIRALEPCSHFKKPPRLVRCGACSSRGSNSQGLCHFGQFIAPFGSQLRQMAV